MHTHDLLSLTTIVSLHKKEMEGKVKRKKEKAVLLKCIDLENWSLFSLNDFFALVNDLEFLKMFWIDKSHDSTVLGH